MLVTPGPVPRGPPSLGSASVRAPNPHRPGRVYAITRPGLPDQPGGTRHGPPGAQPGEPVACLPRRGRFAAPLRRRCTVYAYDRQPCGREICVCSIDTTPPPAPPGISYPRALGFAALLVCAAIGPTVAMLAVGAL